MELLKSFFFKYIFSINFGDLMRSDENENYILIKQQKNTHPLHRGLLMSLQPITLVFGPF